MKKHITKLMFLMAVLVLIATNSVFAQTKIFTENDWLSQIGYAQQPANWAIMNVADDPYCASYQMLAFGWVDSTGDLELAESSVEDRIVALDGATCYAVYYNTTFVHDPSTEGALLNFDYSEKTNNYPLLPSVFNQQNGFVCLVQNGKPYIALNTLHITNYYPEPFLWSNFDLNPYSANGLTASDFVWLCGPSVDPSWVDVNDHPDFSVTGSPINFGYIRQVTNTELYSFTDDVVITARYDAGCAPIKRYEELHWEAVGGYYTQPDDWEMVSINNDPECSSEMHAIFSFADQDDVPGNTGTHEVLIIVDALDTAENYVLFKNNTFTHDPSIEGEITGVDYHEETYNMNYAWELGEAYCGLTQNGKVYIADNTYHSTVGSIEPKPRWIYLDNYAYNASSLQASDFTRLVSPDIDPTWRDVNDHPDFSATGSVITFGTIVKKSGGMAITFMDDIKFNIHYTHCPVDTTVSGTVVDSNTSSVNCNAQLVGRSYTWKVLSTGENGVGTVGTGGAISFVVTSAGTSDICIKVDGALSVKAEGVTLSGTVDVGALAVTLPDLLNDDVLDDFDLNEINGGFGNTVYPGTGGDYNCDGVYDDFDLNQINGSFGSTGACYGL